jgi:hypothetical protein
MCGLLLVLWIVKPAGTSIDTELKGGVKEGMKYVVRLLHKQGD